jgi:uncharacterized protein YdhG (YjbR/CyaY superfamily)
MPNWNWNTVSGKMKFKTVDEYFDSQPANARVALLELKDCILKAEPNATELLNYNIPAYALVENGKREQQIMIAGYKKHVGLYPHPTTIEKFDSELSEYKRAKGSVQFPLDKPLPKELIIRMIKYRTELLKNKDTAYNIVS